MNRESLLAVVDALPEAALTVIPDGFNNHVLWNAGHLAATEQQLTLGLSGLPLDLPEGFVDDLRKGSSPRHWRREWTWAEVRELLLMLPNRAGDFFPFQRPYRTTPGVVLEGVNDAVRFNLYHEEIRLGAILALRKLVG